MLNLYRFLLKKKNKIISIYKNKYKNVVIYETSFR